MARMEESARPTPKMVRLYRRLVADLGEPEDVWVFDPQELPQPNDLRLIHVPVWPANEARDVTVFNTLGMSERRMKGAEHLVELRLLVRAALEQKQRQQLGGFLANLAEYPFENDLGLDWWEVINNPGRIPFFPGCKHLLLHPKLGPDGTNRLRDRDGSVKLLHVVPITPQERQILVGTGRTGFRRHVKKHVIDLLQDRQDAAEPEGPAGRRKRIHCDEHGESEPCMICRHLREETGLGFYRVTVDPGQDDYETALCEACDELFWEEEGWTDRLFDFADWQLYCRSCFEKTLRSHRLLGIGKLAPDEE
jgi:hypothetical protein